MSDFKVGDKVKCVNPLYSDSWGVGYMVIEHVFSLCGFPPSFHCLHNTEGLGSFNENEIQLVLENKFNIGDKVMCISIISPEWCNVEMVVQSTKNDTWVYCDHPKKGIGMFKEHELVKVTEEKPASLELQKQELLKQLEQIDKQLTDKKLEEQMKLGEKEVEIKLTLNELAWVVANVGVTNENTTTAGMSEDYYLGEIEYKFKPPVDNQHGELYDKLGDVLKEQFE